MRKVILGSGGYWDLILSQNTYPFVIPNVLTTCFRGVTMKYILVTGGVISGIGKGVVASSLGVILKHCGVPATSIKIDPYINIGENKI